MVCWLSYSAASVLHSVAAILVAFSVKEQRRPGGLHVSLAGQLSPEQAAKEIQEHAEAYSDSLAKAWELSVYEAGLQYIGRKKV